MNTITLKSLLSAQKYRRMSIKKLSFIICAWVSFEDYKKLKGKHSTEKAEILYKKWRRGKGKK